jgi:hypothetical protein
MFLLLNLRRLHNRAEGSVSSVSLSVQKETFNRNMCLGSCPGYYVGGVNKYH